MKIFKASILIIILAIPIHGAGAAGGHFSSATSDISTLVLTDDQDTYPLADVVEVLVGGSEDTSFEELASGQFQGEFIHIDEVDISDQQEVWLRFQIKNQASPRTAWMLAYKNYRINEVAAYLPDDSQGGYRLVRTGNKYPFSSRDIEYQYYVFNLHTHSDTTETVYLHLADVSGIIHLFPLKIESFERFSQTAFTQYFWSGAYYFFVITILIYTVLFIFSLRDHRVASFAVFLLTVILSSISSDGFGHQLVWRNSVWLGENATLLSVILYQAALLNFSMRILKFRQHFPRWEKYVWVYIILSLLSIGLRWIPGIEPEVFSAVSLLFVLGGFAAPIVLAIRIFSKERRLSLFFIGILLVYLMMIIISTLNVVRGTGQLNNTVVNRIAFSWVLIVFTYISNDQIMNIRKEREQAHKELLIEKEEALRAQKSLTKVMEESRDSILDAYDTTLEGWAQLLEMRDKETEGHSRRVVEMTVRLARALGVDEDEIVHIRRGALLHDIGKVAIPDRILQKPDALTAEEWGIMRRHPEFARKVLSGIPYLEKAMDIPVYHHERWDGSGYPYQLRGEDIPYSARIFMVVDHWEALLSDRPYRDAWPFPRVINYLRDNSGVVFDPEIVPVFLKLIDELGYYS